MMKAVVSKGSPVLAVALLAGLLRCGAARDGKELAARYAKPLALPHDGKREAAEVTVAPGSSVEVFTALSANTLVGIDCTVRGFRPEQAATLWTVLTFDGQVTCEAPFGTFFGCETPGAPAKLETALLTFDTSDPAIARFSNRFPMPFFKSASVRIENRGAAAVRLGATVRTNGTLAYDPARTGHFTATAYRPKTRNSSGQNARIGLFRGRGHMAYGVISGYDFDNQRYGWGSCEGDVRCFIDDMTAPRVQSDGSESWGSWGWGFCAPPQVHPFSSYHSPDGSRLWSELRLTFADCYPFRRFLRFDLEHGAANDHPESSSSGQCFGYVLRASQAAVPRKTDALGLTPKYWCDYENSSWASSVGTSDIGFGGNQGGWGPHFVPGRRDTGKALTYVKTWGTLADGLKLPFTLVACMKLPSNVHNYWEYLEGDCVLISLGRKDGDVIGIKTKPNFEVAAFCKGKAANAATDMVWPKLPHDWKGFHVYALTCKADGTADFYIDGACVGSYTDKTEGFVPLAFDDNVFQTGGCNGGEFSGAYDCYFQFTDDFRIYDSALTAEQISKLSE